jgi:hypothetical protein
VGRQHLTVKNAERRISVSNVDYQQHSTSSSLTLETQDHFDFINCGAGASLLMYYFGNLRSAIEITRVFEQVRNSRAPVSALKRGRGKTRPQPSRATRAALSN